MTSKDLSSVICEIAAVQAQPFQTATSAVPGPTSRPAGGRLQVVQITKDEANAYVERYSRHSVPILQCKFSLGALVGDEFVGVGIVESPKARGNQDGWTCEVTRLVTNGHPNACSFLYGACWRTMKAMGWLHGVTYTHSSESGASVRAAGWVATGYVRGGREWDTPSRPRRPARYELSDRIRWEIYADGWRPGLPPRPVIETATSVPGQMELGHPTSRTPTDPARTAEANTPVFPGFSPQPRTGP